LHYGLSAIINKTISVIYPSGFYGQLK